MFDVDADLVAFDRVGPCPRFSPILSGAKAYTREIDHSIANTYL